MPDRSGIVILQIRKIVLIGRLIQAGQQIHADQKSKNQLSVRIQHPGTGEPDGTGENKQNSRRRQKPPGKLDGAKCRCQHRKQLHQLSASKIACHQEAQHTGHPEQKSKKTVFPVPRHGFSHSLLFLLHKNPEYTNRRKPQHRQPQRQEPVAVRMKGIQQKRGVDGILTVAAPVQRLRIQILLQVEIKEGNQEPQVQKHGEPSCLQQGKPPFFPEQLPHKNQAAGRENHCHIGGTEHMAFHQPCEAQNQPDPFFLIPHKDLIKACNHHRQKGHRQRFSQSAPRINIGEAVREQNIQRRSQKAGIPGRLHHAE